MRSDLVPLTIKTIESYADDGGWLDQYLDLRLMTYEQDGKDKKLSWKQAAFAAWSATPKKMRQPAKLKELATLLNYKSPQVFHKWRKQDWYKMLAIEDMRQSVFMHNLLQVDWATIDAAKTETGSPGVQARRLFYEQMEAMRQARAVQAGPVAVEWERYQFDPVAFIGSHLGSSLTDKQIEICTSVRDHKVTVCQSANGTGKTFTAADIGLWFTRVFPDSKTITCAAPPLENLERLLWGEIDAKLIDNAEVFAEASSGYLNLTFGPDWWLNGVAIPSTGTPAQREAKFSGKHAPYLLFIVDEGDAVPQEVYNGIESCMSGGHVRLLVLFNPREKAGPIDRLVQGGANVIELDAFSHPNVITGEDVIPGAVTRAITVERILNWSRPLVEGEEPDQNDPDWFQVPEFLDGESTTADTGIESVALVGGEWRKVTNPALSYMTLARYPGQAETQLIARAWVEAARQRWLAWRNEHGDQPPEGVRPTMGQDVAEYGPDSNVTCLRYGGYVPPLESWTGVDVLKTADRAAERAQKANARDVFVDETGVGSGVPPGIKRWWATKGDPKYKGRATGVKVASAPTMKVAEGEFKMMRDQLWWSVREWLRTDPGAMLPPDKDLADELCAVQYRVKAGKIVVSDKDALRKLLGRSPDKADALCLTFAKAANWGVR